MDTTAESVGDLLREWRKRRRFSQLDLASEAALSTRHLSFVESGRASASRDMLLRLAEQLAMPLRIRNRLLLAGGFAPEHPERALAAPDMTAAREAVEAVLAAHMPFPALAVDRHWNLVLANAALTPLLADVAAELLTPPVNVLRLSLHPRGLAPRIENLAEWRHHLLNRLARQSDVTGDPVLAGLLAELSALPFRASRTRPAAANAVAVPLNLKQDGGVCLSLLSTTTVFGSAMDVTLAELTLECFYPANAATRAALLTPFSFPDAVGDSS
ncbi:helix-turn-helix domain-containing protein [Chelatococcus asaccharovorans]|uniref:Helix-turn-helix protein n=1 Tax=Chelatococcus asaccharovorans TaxID=28210 RepID=A0A2V3U8J8_9HYPH|nr:helix-turn-helix transcriptional regulator [Chelatococcus asaccharovorans]MBS7705569.1 helix-turn-helix transcriptional regulator [Chelatococcus asaccharovorans]PXW60021.1 helix-turn-helix protein [Chelatococcus asaccharovorans]